MLVPIHRELRHALTAILEQVPGSDLDVVLAPWKRWALSVRAGIYHRAAAAEALRVAQRAEHAYASSPASARLARAAAGACTAALQALGDDDEGARVSVEAVLRLVEHGSAVEAAPGGER